MAWLYNKHLTASVIFIFLCSLLSIPRWICNCCGCFENPKTATEYIKHRI